MPGLDTRFYAGEGGYDLKSRAAPVGEKGVNLHVHSSKLDMRRYIWLAQ
jgi:hypothetical protein